MRLKTIMALALIAPSLAFTLPSVAATNHYFRSQMRSPYDARKQDNELSSRVDHINKELVRMAGVLGYRFPYFDGELSSRVDRINKELVRMADMELGYTFPYFDGELSSRVNYINKELVRMADRELGYKFPYFGSSIQE